MSHNMLTYPKIITNIVFESIPTMPLEFRAWLELDSNVVKVVDRKQKGSVSNDTHCSAIFPD